MKKSLMFLAGFIMLGVITCNFMMGNNIQVFAEEFKNLTARSYIVIDDNKNILIEKNADDKKEVASICKLMTTLITLEEIEKGNLSLDDKLYTSIKASEAEGSQAFLDAGWTTGY